MLWLRQQRRRLCRQAFLEAPFCLAPAVALVLLKEEDLRGVAAITAFDPERADAAYGVQGRYYLVPIFMLVVLGVRYLRVRWPRRDVDRSWVEVSTWAAAATCVWANMSAIYAVAHSYWNTRV